MYKDFQTFDLRVVFNKYENISKASVNKYTDIESPCQAPPSNLKYLIFLP